MAAQREYEERKLTYYSNLLASFVFEERIDRYAANVLLRIGQQLTYRQLCLLSLFSRKEEFPLTVIAPPKKSDLGSVFNVVQPSTPLSYSLRAPLEMWKADLAQEIRDLDHQGILDCDGKYGDFGGYYSHIKVKPLGETIFRLMQLNKVASGDIQELVQLLQIEVKDWGI